MSKEVLISVVWLMLNMKNPLSSLYKNNTWNGDINDRFEQQLRYTRNPIHKARFLLEQGSLLLKNPNQNIQEVGQVLLGRLLETFKVVL